MKILPLLFILFASFPLVAEVVTGSFVPPSERADDTPLPLSEIDGYKLYVDGVFAGNQTYISGKYTTFSIDLPIGVYDLNITTVDSGGRESVFSNTLTLNISAAPNPPVLQ